MPIIKLCQAPCCCRPREEGSKYCVQHREKYEARDAARREEYLKTHPIKRGGSVYQEFYQTSRWHKESKEFLRDNPYCFYCGNKATQVHHEWQNQKYSSEEMFFDKSHWVPVCHRCHLKRHGH